MSHSSYTSGADSILNTIRSLEYTGGETHTDDAVNQATRVVFGQDGDRPNATNVAIIITDGMPYPPDRRRKTITNVESLQSIATTFAIGITDETDDNLLMLLSSRPRELNVNYFTAPNFTQLKDNLQPVLSSVCVPPTIEIPSKLENIYIVYFE